MKEQNILDSLNFVKGAIGKKNLNNTLTHFSIERGTIRSYNGILGLCAPISLNIDCKPKALDFIKAVQNCKSEQTALSLTKTKRLKITSGKFKAIIDTIDEETPHVLPAGETYDIDGTLLMKALAAMEAFVGDDASKPWSNGILIDNGSLFATNNVILSEYWTGLMLPHKCNIPRMAVRELLRIKKIPQNVRVTDSSITFIFGDDLWLRTTLLNSQWPEVKPILNSKGSPVPIHNEFFQGLETLKHFTDDVGRIYLSDGAISTSPIKEVGAAYALEGFPHEGVYSYKNLALLTDSCTAIDFSTYPAPSPFLADGMRGVIVGMCNAK